MIIKTLHLDKQGLELFVSNLEAAILRVLWEENRPLTSVVVHKRLVVKGYPQAFNTIDTTMKRMLDPKKGLVTSKDNNSRRYSPIVTTEDEFIVECIDNIFTAIQTNYPDVTIAICSIK